MRIIGRRGWEIAEHLVTPEGVAMNRRGVLAGAAALAIAPASLAVADEAAPRNGKFDPGRAVTDEEYFDDL